MIGYYVHHVGRGHLHRATAVAAASTLPVTGLSSLPRPEDWHGDWVQLPRDDQQPPGTAPLDPTGRGRLHWVPIGDEGLRARATALSAWIEHARPRVLVSDVSVEVALLARLHGVAVVSVVLPGRRDDPAHLLGYDVSTELVAAWPERARAMLPGLPATTADRVVTLGAISRFALTARTPRRPGPPRVVALLGRGGGAPPPEAIGAARRSSPGWSWTVLGQEGGAWVADPSTALQDADVVVCQGGQNSIAEVAAARRPAVVVPTDRPHDEQRTTARALDRGEWPVVVEDAFPRDGWSQRLDRAAALDGALWAGWCDGLGARRFADLLLSTCDAHSRPGWR